MKEHDVAALQRQVGQTATQFVGRAAGEILGVDIPQGHHVPVSGEEQAGVMQIDPVAFVGRSLED